MQPPHRLTRLGAALLAAVLACAFGAVACKGSGGSGAGGGKKTKRRRRRGPSLVSVARAEPGKLTDRWTFLGDVRPLSSSTLAAGAEGAVRRVLVRAGDRVKRGQLLVEVDPRLALAVVRAARARVSQTVEELAQAKREVARFKRLGRKSVSQLELERARSKATALAAKLAGERAAVAQAGARLARHRVRAPYAGVISKRYVDPGAWVGVGGKVIDIVSTGGVEVMVSSSSQLLAHIKPGDKAQLSQGARRASATVAGVVPALDPVARTARVRLVPDKPDKSAKSASGTKSALLLPGSSVAVAFSVQRKGVGVVLPRDALVIGAVGRRVVKVVERKGKLVAVNVDVEVLARAGDRVLVVRRVPRRDIKAPSGRGAPMAAATLAVGDRVVVRGNERLRPGQAVRLAGAPPRRASAPKNGSKGKATR